MNEFVPYLGYLVAAGFAFYAFNLRRQLADIKAILLDAGTKAEQQQNRLKQAEQSLISSQKLAEQSVQEIKKLEKKLSDQQHRLREAEKQGQQFSQKQHEESQKTIRQLDHFQEQNTVLTQQLAEAIREKKSMQDHLKQLESNYEKEVQSRVEPVEKKLEESQEFIRNLKKENRKLEQRIAKAKEILKKVDPSETKKLKARLSSTDQLYKSMKGLREMAEERNQNWESAIRLLSCHITNRRFEDSQQSPVGPLLGEALEKIGASLEESAPDNGASQQFQQELINKNTPTRNARIDESPSYSREAVSNAGIENQKSIVSTSNP